MKALTQEQVEQFRRHGYLRVEGACAANLEEYRKAVEEHASRPDPLVAVRFGKNGEPIHCKIPQLAERDVLFRRLAQGPRLVSAVEDLIGPAVIFRDVVIAKPPRAGTIVRYHQDAAYWDVNPADRVLSAWIALDDAPEEAGCLRVLPGSHDSLFPHGLAIGGRRVPRFISAALRRAVSLTGTGDNPRTPGERVLAIAKKLVLGSATRLVPVLNDLNDLHIPEERIPQERIVSLPVQAGDVILFLSRLVHGSGPNTSAQPRRAYIVTYMGSGCRVAGEDSSRFLPASDRPAPARS